MQATTNNRGTTHLRLVPAFVEEPAEPASVDVYVTNEGSLFRFELNTPSAREWVEEKVSIEPYMWLGNATFACEHRYAADLVEGMIDAGLVVE